MSLADDAHDLLERRDALLDLLEPVGEHRLHPFGDRLLADVPERRRGEEERANRLAHAEDLEDADLSLEARAAAHVAALAPVERLRDGRGALLAGDRELR